MILLLYLYLAAFPPVMILLAELMKLFRESNFRFSKLSKSNFSCYLGTSLICQILRSFPGSQRCVFTGSITAILSILRGINSLIFSEYSTKVIASVMHNTLVCRIYNLPLWWNVLILFIGILLSTKLRWKMFINVQNPKWTKHNLMKEIKPYLIHLKAKSCCGILLLPSCNRQLI